MKLVFGSKKRYKYKSKEHTCHACNKGIMKGLQLHHHHGKKSKGGTKVTAIHDKCHKKTHGNYNHILTKEDRRKAGLKTYQNNLRNQKNFVARRPSLGNLNNQGVPRNSTASADRPQVESR